MVKVLDILELLYILRGLYYEYQLTRTLTYLIVTTNIHQKLLQTSFN